MPKQKNKKSLLGKIVTKAWGDEGFKKRLLEDAGAVLKEEGFDIPEGLIVRAVENTEKVVHIIIPDKPPVHEAEATPLQTEKVAGCNCWQGEAWN